jgi:hypothetical protein
MFPALVNVVTVEFVVSQSISVTTSALVGALDVDAGVRTVVQVLALVHIEAGLTVVMERVAGLAGAHLGADEVDADIRAVSVVLHALVDITAREAVLAQLVALGALALKRSFRVDALLLAATR